MMLRKILAPVIMLMVLSGCAPFFSNSPPHTVPPSPNQRIRKYERQVVKRALLLEQKGQWVKAEAVFNDGLRFMPDSGLIQTARDRFLQRRTNRQAALDAELALAKGNMLMAQAEALAEAIRLRGANLATEWKQTINNSERKAMAADLTRHGNAAMKRQDFELARDCFGLSMVLFPTGEAARAMNRVDRALSARPTMPPPRPPRPPRPALKAKVAKKSKPKQVPALPKPTAQAKEPSFTPLSEAQRMEIMQMEFERAYSKGQFAAAQHHMAMLQASFPNDDRISRLADQFNMDIMNRIESDLRRGRRLYSSGDVRGALTVWRRALTLAPGNEDLRTNVARAEKVLENIKALTEKQVK